MPKKKIDIEALERLMKPEDEEACLRYILKYPTREEAAKFSSSLTQKKDHFVASRRRWLERQGEGGLARKLAK